MKPEEIKKPLTIRQKEFMENILTLCNNSSLPAFCMKYVFAEFTKAMDELSQKEYCKDMQDYQQQLKEIESEE